MLEQRIVVDLVDGKLEDFFLVLSIEDGEWLIIVVVQQVVDFAFGAETVAEDTAHTGVLVLDASNGFVHQLEVVVLCRQRWFVERTSHCL